MHLVSWRTAVPPRLLCILAVLFKVYCRLQAWKGKRASGNVAEVEDRGVRVLGDSGADTQPSAQRLMGSPPDGITSQ